MPSAKRAAPELAVSSSWIENPYDPAAAVARVQAIGLRAVELEYRIGRSAIRPLAAAFANAGIAIRSLHNFCPYPEDCGRAPSGDLFDLASLDPEERSLAVRYTGETIRYAAGLGAKAVVLHLGAASIPATDAIRAAFVRGAGPTRAVVAAHLAERAKYAIRHREHVLRSLESLDAEAARRGIRLGLETRVHLHEIPDEDETAWLLDALRGGVTGYWHDAGHAHVRQTCGVGTQHGWLERFASSLVGVHLHDARGLDDHLVPGDGEIEFRPIADRLPRDRDVLRTLELGPHWPVEAVRAGIRVLETAGLAGDQWNEGDVSCSVVRRIMLPDAFLAMDGLLETLLTVLDQMEVFEAVVETELNRYLPFLLTTTVMMESVKKFS